MKIKRKQLEWALEKAGIELQIDSTYPRGRISVLATDHTFEPNSIIAFIVGTGKRRRAE